MIPQQELELRVGMIQGGDSMEEGEKSCWERRKAALYLTVSALIILSFVILIVYIALGGLVHCSVVFSGVFPTLAYKQELITSLLQAD